MKVFIGKYPKSHKRKQKINVQIDAWDTWSMDVTLAHIVVPMLKQLKATQHGAPAVDMEDVPNELRSQEILDTDKVDAAYFKRWEYVLDEMIFAFESKLIDWEEQFWKTKPELNMTEYLQDIGKYETPLRWKVEGECDWGALKAYQERITNGFRLFGKYYEGLWD